MTGSRVTEVKGKDPGGSREAIREGERKGLWEDKLHIF